jgi:HD-GYP domain-containing protein (c-di-GMP phosphodiesterase class II)
MCEQHLSDEEREHRPTGAAALVDEIVVALTNARIYAPEHPRMKSALASLHTDLQAMVRSEGGKPVRIGAADGFLFHDQRPLLGATLSAKRLLEPLGALESGGLSFAAGTGVEDLQAFVRFLGREVGRAKHFREANAALDQAGCRTVRFLPPFCTNSGSWTDEVEARLATDQGPTEAAGSGGAGAGSGSATPDTTPASEHAGLLLDLDFNVPMRLHQDTVKVMQDAMLHACSGENVDTSAASGMVESILTRLATDPGAMLGQTRYEKYDAFTFGHSIRVCYLALNFARHLTSNPKLLQQIGLAGLMHDVGKAWVPFDILHSTGRLSDEERLEMNMHTIHGGQILLEAGKPDPVAVATAFSHHQNADGSGYPAAIRGLPQSAATMIVKIADVYEALTAVRPYKPRMAPIRAYRIMIDMQGHFEPSLLRRFIEVNGIYPVGSRVRLSSGEIARVEELTDSLREPIVRPLVHEDGLTRHGDSTALLDLREVFGRNKISVVEHVLEAA